MKRSAIIKIKEIDYRLKNTKDFIMIRGEERILFESMIFSNCLTKVSFSKFAGVKLFIIAFLFYTIFDNMLFQFSEESEHFGDDLNKIIFGISEKWLEQ